jgi:acetylglutamate/LysW-gamma-L-alpha-aminoadipate kinase
VESVSGYTSRYTDRETLEIFNMVYAGKMNKMMVEKLQKLGVNAIGLSGMDGRLLEGRRKSVLKIVEAGKKKILRGDHSGIIERVNVKLLRMLLNSGYKPVLTPPAISYEGTAINVDGDRVAAELAKALKADKLIILSNVPGLLLRVEDESSLIKRIPADEIEHYFRYAQGRMKKKLLAAKEALEGGVGVVILADGRVKQPITKAFQGAGTWVRCNEG